VCENPSMTFAIKKRINTELVIDRKAALYIVEIQIRVWTSEGDHREAQADRRNDNSSLFWTKMCVNERSGLYLSQNELTEM